MSNVPKVKSPTPPQGTGHTQPRSVTPRGTPNYWVPQEETLQQPQQQQIFFQGPGGFYQQQGFQQQVPQQQNYPHDINKQLGNPQLVTGQGLPHQQNMYSQQPRSQAPFYASQPVRPPQQQRMQTMGQQQQQQVFPLMYMQPSQAGGNINAYGTPIMIQSNPQITQMMIQQSGQRMPTPQPPYSSQAVAGGYQGMPQTSYPNTTVVYQVPSMTQRPPSASGMSQQPQQPLPAKRERKVLQIVDPSTGKDIMSDVITNRQTPPGQSSRGQTPNEHVEVQQHPNETNAIAAQFAAQVAATMKIGGHPNHAHQDHPIQQQAGHPGTAVVQQVHSQVAAEESSSNIPQETVSAVPENPQSLSTSETVSEHSQSNVEPKDSRTNVLDGSGGKSPANSKEPSREPSQEPVSAKQESVVDRNIKEKVTVEATVVSEPPNTKSEEVVQTSDKLKPVVKSEENVTKESSVPVETKPEPSAAGEPAGGTDSSAVAKETKKEKSKKKMKDFNKKDLEGSDMDAFVDTKPVKEVEPEVPTTVKPVEADVPAPEKEEEVKQEEQVPTVEITVQDKVQQENEKNAEMSAEEETDSMSQKLKYTYKEDQWSPINMEGKKLYDREFLLQLQFAEKSTTKPKGLPDLPDIILDAPQMGGSSRGQREFSFTASQGSGFDFTPGYVKGTPSRSGNLPKRNSQQKRIPDRPSAQKVINLSSMQQEVKLHKAESAWKPSHKEPKEDKSEDEVKTEELYKKARGILNKLTPQKFQTLVKQMSELEITSEEHLKGVAQLVFEKAIAEPGFSVAYASMCRYLTQIKVKSDSKPGEQVNFRAILLTRCQREFEQDKKNDEDIQKMKAQLKEAAEDKKAQIEEEIELAETNNRRRSLGNIRFIGELFKLKMLTEPIMHECVFKLLNNKDEESLECLCKLLRTIGKELDSDKAKPRVDQYFQRMHKIVEEKKTSSRVRFMLQDIIELRQSHWVPRRDENNPKTIEQIHKEAKQEEQEKLLLLNTISVQQRNQPQAGGGGARGSRGGGPPRMAVGQPGMGGGAPDGWNTVGGGRPNMRGERQTIDPSRLKISRQNVDENIQLGPGGGAARFSGWGRGSSGGGASKSSQEQEKQAPGNRFSALSKPEEEGRSRYGVSPARDGGRGRGFGRPKGITPRSSQEQEKERALAAARSIAGGQTTPREGPSRESSRGREPRDSSSKEPVVAAPSTNQLSEDEMVKKTHAILDEYLHIQDIKEALQCVEELNSPSTLHVFVSECINQVLERSNVARRHTGLLLHDLVKKNIISVKQYLQGLNTVLGYAEDMEIDIPKIWQYFGELLGPMVQDGSVPLSFLKEACEPLKESGKAGILMAEILHDASDREGHKKVGDLWRKSGLEWSEFVPEEKIAQFLKDKKLDFTTGDGSQPSTPTVRMPIDTIQTRLQDLIFNSEVKNEEVFDWIEENLDDVTAKDKKFIRVLMTAVCSSAITGKGNNAKVDPLKVTQRAAVLLKYLDHSAEFELQALYALQALVHKLEHPPGVLRTLFDTLYDEDIISEDAFNQWETSKDPAEQEGKGVAMKQVVQFFTWLREADDDVDS